MCFGFDAAALGAEAIDAVRWHIAKSGTTVHHALLYAVTADYPDGPLVCNGMPAGSVGLHVWSPGGDDLELPNDTGLLIPDGTRRFVVEAHVLQTASNAVAESSVTLCGAPDSPAHRARLMPTAAPVPALRPHQQEHSRSTCALQGDVHLRSAWPHMHLAGKEISGELVHDGLVTRMVHPYRPIATRAP